VIEATEIEAISKELADGLRQIYGPKLREIVLYGSWARGEAGEESDVDYLVVLDDYEGFSKELNRIVEVSAELGLKHDVFVSAQPIKWERYRNAEEMFLEEVRREGRRVA
jgi:predicted nucleotidyltransferase